MNDDIQFEIAKLTLKPGDVLVIRIPVWVESSQEKRINDAMKELLAKAGHPDTQVMVLGPDAILEILEHAAPEMTVKLEPGLFLAGSTP